MASPRGVDTLSSRMSPGLVENAHHHGVACRAGRTGPGPGRAAVAVEHRRARLRAGRGSWRGRCGLRGRHPCRSSPGFSASSRAVRRRSSPRPSQAPPPTGRSEAARRGALRTRAAPISLNKLGNSGSTDEVPDSLGGLFEGGRGKRRSVVWRALQQPLGSPNSHPGGIALNCGDRPAGARDLYACALHLASRRRSPPCSARARRCRAVTPARPRYPVGAT